MTYQYINKFRYFGIPFSTTGLLDYYFEEIALQNLDNSEKHITPKAMFSNLTKTFHITST